MRRSISAGPTATRFSALVKPDATEILTAPSPVASAKSLPFVQVSGLTLHADTVDENARPAGCHNQLERRAGRREVHRLVTRRYLGDSEGVFGRGYSYVQRGVFHRDTRSRCASERSTPTTCARTQRRRASISRPENRASRSARQSTLQEEPAMKRIKWCSLASRWRRQSHAVAGATCRGPDRGDGYLQCDGAHGVVEQHGQGGILHGEPPFPRADLGKRHPVLAVRRTRCPRLESPTSTRS